MGNNKSMRVLHVFEPRTGGVPIFVSQLAHDMRGTGMDVTLLGPSEFCEHQLIPARGILAMIRNAVRCQRLMRKLRPEIVHAHSFFAGIFVRAFCLRGCAVVYSPHAWVFYRGGVVGRIGLYVEAVLARRTHGFLFVSKAEQGDAPRGASSRLAEVAGVPVSKKFLDARSVDQSHARSAVGIEHAGPTAVCVGRITAQKGQDRLIALARQASSQAVRFYLVGPVEEPELIANLPSNVMSVGPTDLAEMWFRAADVVLMPSRWEGLPIAAIEALSCGVCVVASDITSFVELARRIPRHRDSGLLMLVDEVDFQLLDLSAVDVARDGRPLRDQAMDEEFEQFTPASVSSHVVSLYKQVLSNYDPVRASSP